MSAPAWYTPYAGLPLPIQILFWFALAVIVLAFGNVVTLWVLARLHHSPGLHSADESDFLWVFMVPALNEEVTITDSVTRLSASRATHKMIMVVDDGSDDATPDVLSRLVVPDLRVLRRDLPDARKGKADALNMAWRCLHDLLRLPQWRGWDSAQVIVVVVDADGRLSADAPRKFARHFVDERVGGVQSLVRIYNRSGFLTWAQDAEFAVSARVYQLGRTVWGTANMGGNGQANRLAALDSITGAAVGPWRDRLTEDQDVGVRLLQAGWRGAQDTEATVEQQGLSSWRQLYRQRTRWSQGGWESVGLLAGLGRIKCSLLARCDALLYLLTPILQLVTGAALVMAAVVALVFTIPLWASAVPILVFFLALTFVPGLLGLMSRGQGIKSVASAVLAVLPYTLYSWMIYPVVVRALMRLVVRRSSWTKTAREPIAAAADSATGTATDRAIDAAIDSDL